MIFSIIFTDQCQTEIIAFYTKNSGFFLFSSSQSVLNVFSDGLDHVVQLPQPVQHHRDHHPFHHYHHHDDHRRCGQHVGHHRHRYRAQPQHRAELVHRKPRLCRPQPGPDSDALLSSTRGRYEREFLLLLLLSRKSHCESALYLRILFILQDILISILESNTKGLQNITNSLQ